MKRLALVPLSFIGGLAIAIGIVSMLAGLLIKGYVEDLLDQTPARKQAHDLPQAPPTEALVSPPGPLPLGGAP